MIRRIAAILLIATSAWLLYQTASDSGLVAHPGDFPRLLSHVDFLLPASGGALGLLGGLLILFGGPGGAAIAMIGGVVAAGFSFYVGRSLHFEGIRVWENETVVGIAILVLAGLAALLGRD